MEFFLNILPYIGLTVLIIILVLFFMKKRKANSNRRLPEQVIPSGFTLSQILDAYEDLCIVCGDKDDILHMNQTALAFFSFDNSVVGKPLQEILPNMYTKVVGHTRSSFQESFVIEKESNYHEFILKTVPITSKELNGYMITLKNNNHVVQLEKEMQTLKSSSENALKSKNMFLANMSHELRTPLNAIIGMSELLLDTNLGPTQQDLIHSINQSANILYDIINTILDFSKLEANQMGLESISIEVPKLMEELEAVFAHQASVKKIELKFDVSQSIPIVKGDPVRLRQILVNIIGNAIKFTHLGSVHVSVQTKSSDRNNVILEFKVTDTGIGFPPEVKDKIFDPFIQEDDSMTRKFGGTGLGLPICKSLVLLHQGVLEVNSAVGKGSEFIVSIPYPIASDNQNYDYKKVAVRPTVSAKILVAEDNQTNQKLLKMQLKNLNYDVNIVENGQQAVEEYFENDYDIIIMDCQMPIMDGFCATLIIRQQEELFNRHIPIVALTASALKEDKEKCIECGMDDYITKPVKIETLHKTLQHWLNQQKSETTGR